MLRSWPSIHNIHACVCFNNSRTPVLCRPLLLTAEVICNVTVAEAVTKNGASVIGLSLSQAVNASVCGIINLSSALANGLEALKTIVSSANQAVL